MAKITATHVPYKGSAQGVTDIVGGQVTYTFETSATVLGHVKAGRLKALGVSSANRAIALPELPTIAEGAIFRASTCAVGPVFSRRPGYRASCACGSRPKAEKYCRRPR